MVDLSFLGDIFGAGLLVYVVWQLWRGRSANSIEMPEFLKQLPLLGRSELGDDSSSIGERISEVLEISEEIPSEDLPLDP